MALMEPEPPSSTVQAKGNHCAPLPMRSHTLLSGWPPAPDTVLPFCLHDGTKS